MSARAALLIGLTATFFGLAQAGAQTTDRQQTDRGIQQAEKLQIAVDAMQKALLPGPTVVALRDKAQLRLPDGAAFVRQPEAGDWAAVSGDDEVEGLVGPDLIGIVIPTKEGENWTIYLDYRSGHVFDKRARDAWYPDDLLANLKLGIARDNEIRAKQQLSALEATGWLVKPEYDRFTHRMLWSADIKEEGDTDDDGKARIHGYALGKDDYVEMTFVLPAGEARERAPLAKTLLGGIVFNPGQRYQDYASAPDTGEPDVTDLISTAAPGIMGQVLGFLGRTWKLLSLGLGILIIAIWWLSRRNV